MPNPSNKNTRKRKASGVRVSGSDGRSHKSKRLSRDVELRVSRLGNGRGVSKAPRHKSVKRTILRTASSTTVVTVSVSLALFRSSLPSLHEMCVVIDNIKELAFRVFDLVACILVLAYVIIKHLRDLGLITRRRSK